MMTWQLILALAAVLLLGLLRQVHALRSMYRHIRLVAQFQEHFVAWCNGKHADTDKYNWLTQHSRKVQTLLGQDGLINYRKPYEVAYHHDMPIVMNFLSEIQTTVHQDFYRGNRIAEGNRNYLAQAVDDALKRWLGAQWEVYDSERAESFNPIVLFGRGISVIVEIPLIVLEKAGAISKPQKAKFSRSWLFAIASGVVALTAFVGSLMGIVFGWSDFLEKVSRILPGGGGQ